MENLVSEVLFLVGLWERVNSWKYCMWWPRCDSLKCLLCLWKSLWTNECELLATPAYKRCICVRQRKGPACVMGDGASACGMSCLGERAGAEQMQSVYLANQTCWSPTGKFTQELKCKSTPFFQTGVFVVGYSVVDGEICVDQSAGFSSLCLPVFSFCLYICEHPLSFFFLRFSFSSL